MTKHTEIFDPIDDWHKIILPDQRDPDGYYDLDTGFTHSYQFSVPPLGQSVVILEHHYRAAQDFSIIGWFSYRPIYPKMFESSYLDDDFPVSRAVREFSFKDKLLVNVKAVGLDNRKKYWLNLKNRQNSPNQYRLIFTY